jgi:hypothetical protein
MMAYKKALSLLIPLLCYLHSFALNCPEWRESQTIEPIVIASMQWGANSGEIGIDSVGEDFRHAPPRIDVDTAQNIYLLDVVNNRISKYSPSGAHIKDITYNIHVSDFAIREDGNLILLGGKTGVDVFVINQNGVIVDENYFLSNWRALQKSLNLVQPFVDVSEGYLFSLYSISLSGTGYIFNFVLIPNGHTYDQKQEELGMFGISKYWVVTSRNTTGNECPSMILEKRARTRSLSDLA